MEGLRGRVSGRILRLKRSEESRVLLEKVYWDVGMEEVQKQEMKIDMG